MSTRQATAWQKRLAPRWERVRAACVKRGWDQPGSPTIASIAAKHGIEWYDKRAADRVDDFAQLGSDSLFNRLHGFGRIKCERLVDILHRALAESEDCEEAECDETPQYSALTHERFMVAWGVPADYPLSLVPLPQRLLNLCQGQQIGTLKALLQFWEAVGREGLLAHRNMGRRTVDEMEELANAVMMGDAKAARKWLPLNDTEDGLMLRAAVGIMVAKLTTDERTLITRRLVEGMTLEESATSHGLTRERVRQIVEPFLSDLRAALNWFGDDYKSMLELWTERSDWNSFVTPQSCKNDTNLVIAGIEAIFGETPQRVARRLAAESEIQAWIDRLCADPDFHLGGVDLQAFMSVHVPDPRRAEFVAAVSSNADLAIDHTKGVVKPCSPSVRDTVRAVLQREDDPIPLTWLARMVTAVSGNEEGDAHYIRRNRYHWNNEGILELGRVLWNQ